MDRPWPHRDDGLPAMRRYPSSDTWTSVSDLVRKFSEHYATTQLLMDLALGRVEKCPFPSESAKRTQRRDHRTFCHHGGLNLDWASDDRNELPIDFRFLDAPPQSVRGSRHAVGELRTGCESRARDEDAEESGAVQAKKEVEVGTATGPTELVSRRRSTSAGLLGGRTNASLVGFADKVEAVLEDQASRGQVLKFTEAEARARFPNLVVVLAWSSTQRQA